MRLRNRHFLTLVYFSLVLISLSGCVENHKVVLMQKADLKKKVVYDSVQRRYNAPNTYYRVQTNDLISVRYQSLTAKDVDFFAQETQANGATLNIGAGGNALLLGELVDKDGSIPVPVIGKVKVAGMTVFEIQDMIQELANKYLDSPIVKVRLLNYRFTVLGEVLKEGTVYVGNNRVNMFEAMGLAGGLGDLADRGKIKLVRTDSAGVTTVQYINLLDENFIMSPYYYVHQNDLLIVPPLRQRAYRKYFGPNLALVLSSLSIVLLTINLTK